MGDFVPGCGPIRMDDLLAGEIMPTPVATVQQPNEWGLLLLRLEDYPRTNICRLLYVVIGCLTN